MVLNNFKSYAGTREIGPFHESFTSIVGPNGSGKSNVLDAIQFVFGKKGSKLRLKRLSELIHRSKHHTNCERASVSVHFAELYLDTADSADGDSESQNREFRQSLSGKEVPGSRFIITRAVDRRSRSEYFVDRPASSDGSDSSMTREKSSYKEVTQLLRNKGVDLDYNRFLILQGEVELISQMKPRGEQENEVGLLEYIEDIIGTARYKPVIENRYTLTEELNEQRQERLQRLKASERERDHLQEGKKKAENYLIAKMSIIQKRITMYRKQLELLQAQGVSKRERQVKRLKTQLDSVQSEMRELMQGDTGTTDKYTTLKNELSQLQRELSKQEEKWQKLDRANTKLETEMKQKEDRRGKLEKQIEVGSKKIEEFEHRLEQLLKDEEKTDNDLEKKLRPELHSSEQSLEILQKEMNSELEPLRLEIEKQQQKNVMPARRLVNDTKQSLQLKRDQQNIAREQRNSHKRQLQDQKEKLQQLQDQQKESNIRLNQQKKTKKDISEKRIPNLQSELQKIGTVITDKQQELDRHAADLHRMKQELQSTASQSRLLTALLKQRDNGTISGIYDRLGNLAMIPKEYDVAISTVAKSALDMIVVENSECGKLCVEFLRKNQLGTCSFILLDKIQQGGELVRRMNTKKNFPASRLFDLIRYFDEDQDDDDARMQNIRMALYFALGDTLVCKDLDEGTRIAYHGRTVQYRVVTMKGEVINTTGTMSGGGNKVISGAMRLDESGRGSNRTKKSSRLVTDEQVQACEKTVEELTSEIAKLRQQETNMQQQLQELQHQSAKILDREINKLTIDIGAFDQQIAQLKQQIEESDDAMDEDEEDENTDDIALAKEIGKLERKLAVEQSELDRHEDVIKSLQEQMEQVGGGKLKQQKQKVAVLQKQIEELEQKLNKLQVQQKQSQRQMEKKKKENEQMEAELETIVEELKKLQIELEQLVESATDVHTQKVELADRRNEIETEIAALQEAVDEHRKKLESLKTQEQQMKHKVQNLESELAGSRKQAEIICTKIERARQELSHFRSSYPHMQWEDDDEGNISQPNEDAMELDEENHEDDVDNEGHENETVDQGQAAKLNMLIKKLATELTIEEETLARQAENVQLDLIESYLEKDRECQERQKALEDVTENRNRAQRQLDSLKKKRFDEFMSGFKSISMELKQIYQLITLGGDAELELADSLDPFSEGIIFSVRPAKKSWKTIRHLSGGEKTLSSLALVFALHRFKPTPIYIMDEIDAALDFRNVSIVANYVKERTRNAAQFIIISLRNNMFELADILVGIYKTNDVTKSVAVNPQLMAERQRQQRARQNETT